MNDTSDINGIDSCRHESARKEITFRATEERGREKTRQRDVTFL